MHWIVQQRHGPGGVEGEDIFLEVHCAAAVVVEYSEDGLSQEDSLISQRSLTVYHPDHGLRPDKITTLVIFTNCFFVMLPLGHSVSKAL